MNVTCSCGTTFEARNARAKHCSDRCRKRNQRGGSVVALPPAAEPSGEPVIGQVEAATRRELTEAGRLESARGQACLALARRLDSPGVDTGSALASVAGRLEDMLAKATEGSGGATAPQKLQDELATRRAKHA